MTHFIKQRDTMIQADIIAAAIRRLENNPDYDAMFDSEQYGYDQAVCKLYDIYREITGKDLFDPREN